MSGQRPYSCVGKQVLMHGQHFADAATEQAAFYIAMSCNNAHRDIPATWTEDRIMTPAPASAAAEVVRGLTRKQREAIAGRHSVEGVWFNLNGSRAGGSYSRMCDRLAAIGLVDRHGPHPLTPLGLEVRALLKDQEQ